MCDTNYEWVIGQLSKYCAHDAAYAVEVERIISMAEEKDQLELLIRFLFLYKYCPTNGREKLPEPKLDSDELYWIHERLETIIANLKSILGLNEYRMYEFLWRDITESANGDHRKRALFMLFLADRDDVPFIGSYRITGFSQDEFDEGIHSIDPFFLAELRCYTSSRFNASAVASLILPFIDRGETIHDKFIPLALALRFYKKRIEEERERG